MMYLLNGLPAFFGTINITGNIIISGQGLFAAGTNAAPSISFQSDPDTGVYLDAANTLGIATAGAGTVLFSSSAGIGKIKAHGTRVLALEAGTGNTNITLTPSGTGGVLIGGGNYFSYSAGALALNINATSSTISEIKLTNSTTGNAPTAGMMVSCNGNDAYIWNGQLTGALYFGTANATKALFLASGRFLLGTGTDSGALLQIGTNTTTSVGGVAFGTDTFLHRFATRQLMLSAAGGVGLIWNNSTAALDEKNWDVLGGVSNIEFRALNDANTAAWSYLSVARTGISIASVIFKTGAGTTALTLDASQNANFAGHVFASAASSVGINGRSVMRSSADGIMRLTNFGDTDFTRLQFGGTTASFPALARSGTNLLVTDATGGSYTPILAATFWATGPAVTVSAGNVSYGGTAATTVGAAGGASALPATPLGYIIVNVAGTTAKIPYYNA